MKTIQKYLLAALMALCVVYSSIAQTVVTAPVGTSASVSDIEKIANGFAGAKVSYWRGSYYFDGVTNNTSKYMQSTFTIQLINGRWGFTQMSINGSELPIDQAHPMWQIPPYLAGSVKNFQFNLQGYDKNGQPVRYGYYYADTLAPNAPISVTIYLNYVMKKVPFDLPSGVPASAVSIVSDDGHYSGWYDAASGQFYIYYDPINPPTSWLVIDNRYNTIIGSRPFDGSPSGQGANTGNGVALINEGGIPELYLNSADTSWYGHLSGLSCDNPIIRSGASYSGKIVLSHVANTNDYHMVFFNNLRSGSIVQVYGLNTKTGKMDHLYDDWTVPSNQNYLNIYNISGYLDYKFVIIGAPSDPISGFGIDMYDSQGMWNVGIGGGEKG